MRILLLVRLYTAIYLSGDIFDTDSKDRVGPIGPLTLACRSRFRACLRANFLKRVPTQTGLRYRCALAIALAPLTPLPPSVLARYLVAKLTETEASLAAVPMDLAVSLNALGGLIQDVQITASETGWIDFEVSDRTFVAWLQTRLPGAWEVLPAPCASQGKAAADDPTDDLWLAQYAHARCCAILSRMNQAHRITGPNWLQPIEPNALRLTAIGPDSPQARQLALMILDVVDRLEDGNQQADRRLYLASTQELSQAFTDFSQIYQWGHPATDPNQLELIILLQSLLYALLTQGLGQPAPTEL